MADSTVPPPATFPRMTQALSERQTVTSDSPGGRRGRSHQPAGSAAVESAWGGTVMEARKTVFPEGSN